MNRTEFIKLIIDKKSLDKDIFKLSLNLDDFPIARQILNKIDGNIYTETILESNEIVEIQTARGKLISNLVNSLKDSLLKSETRKFIDDLVDQKIFSSSFDKTAQSTKSSSDNKLISELKSLREEKVRESSNEENNFEDRNITSNEDKSNFEKSLLFFVLIFVGIFWSTIFLFSLKENNYCAKNTRGETICIKKENVICEMDSYFQYNKYSNPKVYEAYISCRASGIKIDLAGYKSHWITGYDNYGTPRDIGCYKKTFYRDSRKVYRWYRNPYNQIVCSAAYSFNLINENFYLER